MGSWSRQEIAAHGRGLARISRRTNPYTSKCRSCLLPDSACECGRPGWPGGTRIIPPEELEQQQQQEEAQIQAAVDEFTFDGFED